MSSDSDILGILNPCVLNRSPHCMMCPQGIACSLVCIVAFVLSQKLVFFASSVLAVLLWSSPTTVDVSLFFIPWYSTWRRYVASILLMAAEERVPDRVRLTVRILRRSWRTTTIKLYLLFTFFPVRIYLRFLRKSLNMRIPISSRGTTPTARGCITQALSTVSDRQRSELSLDSRW